MSITNTNQSNIQQAETIANWTQIVVNLAAKYYGGIAGQAFANFLTDNGAIVTSLGDLIDKIDKGTAKIRGQG